MSIDCTLKISTIQSFDFFYNIKSEKTNMLWAGHDGTPVRDKLKVWFENQLKNDSRYIFDVMEENKRVGYTYIDIVDTKTIEISYAISDKYSGRGLATCLISKVLEYIRKSKYASCKIIANVASTNSASVGVLLKNRFKITGSTKKQYFKSMKMEIEMKEFMYQCDHCFIIAEAGVNHNGDIDLAKKLIDVAVEAGVDAVKFQTWKTELLVTKTAKQAEYQIENTNIEESQFDMLKKLELSYDDFRELKYYCDEKKILFLSTPDEVISANFLIELQDIFKIGSGELTNLPFLRHIGGLDKKIIISTGMGTLNEVGDALTILTEAGTPKENITILHANTQYPTPMEDVNLNAMLSMKKEFNVNVGYSDHTLGIEVDIAAVAMGASVIEKHFTLDNTMNGPDHMASLNPIELKSMVNAIRNIELALGSFTKEPSPSEEPNIAIVRKSIVASCSIKKGDKLTKDNLAIKRPNGGIGPMKWDEVIGTVASKDYAVDELI